jgi:signal transduction histidine kinase
VETNGTPPYRDSGTLASQIEVLSDQVKKLTVGELHQYELQEKLDSQLKTQEEIIKLGNKMQTVLDEKEIANLVTETIVESFEYEKAALFIWDESSLDFYLAGMDGYYGESPEESLSESIHELITIMEGDTKPDIVVQNVMPTPFMGMDNRVILVCRSREGTIRSFFVFGNSREKATYQRPIQEHDRTLWDNILRITSSALENALLYKQLEREREDLRNAHENLKKLNDDLEYRVIERTSQFEEANNELKQVLKKLEGTYSDLKNAQSRILQQEKMASIGQLAAGVAHEINNPMGFISSNLSSLNNYLAKITDYFTIQSDLFSKSEDTRTCTALNEKRKTLKIDFIIEDIKDLIQESLEGAERVKKIVQDLKTFSRVDQTEQKPADINECIESTINIVWNELKYKTTLQKEYGDIPQTICYPQQLNQVFMNILVNAAHAIEKQGIITVRTWRENGSIFASFSDTGRGIDPEHLSRIFEPFFTTKEVGKGTGLGLSITYDIIKKHGGEITVQSEVGKGTTFAIHIPIKE